MKSSTSISVLPSLRLIFSAVRDISVPIAKLSFTLKTKSNSLHSPFITEESIVSIAMKVTLSPLSDAEMLHVP